jgi:type I restriction enzyme S subunit
MIADLKPYPEYKESGSPWLERTPAHWRLPRLGSVLRERGETNEQRQIIQVLSVLKDVGVIRYEDKGNIGNKKSDDIARYKIVRPDDIVVNCMNVIIGSVGRSRYVGCLSPVYYVLTRRFDEDDPQYLAAVFSVKPFQLSLVRIGNGILAHRMRIPMELLKCEPFPIPPPDEQAAIVRFLEWANGRLERAIRAKRKVIALLDEQKQAIIHRAVTRGLDPSVPLKPSGIAWLGDIPRHWELRQLGHTIRLQTGFPFASEGFTQGESGTRLLRGINVTPSGLRWDEVVRWQRQPGDGLDEFALKIGDIALGMDRPIIGSGVRAATVQENDTPSLLLQRVARLRPTDSLDAKFLLLLLRGRLFRDYIAPIFTGVSVPHLSPEQIKDFKVPLPPILEQRSIVSSLETETSGLDTGVFHLEREVELLREYRTRLVADVVTGKLDVREVAAHLPEEAPPEAAVPDTDLSVDPEAIDEEVVA